MLTSDIPGPPRLDGGPIPSEIPDWLMWAALAGLLVGLVVFIAVRLVYPTDIRMEEWLGQRAGSRRQEVDDFTERAVNALADEAQEVARAVGVGAASVLLTASVVDMDALASTLQQNQWVVAGTATPLIVAVGAGGEGVKWLARKSPRVRRTARSRYMTRLSKTQHKVR